jgi:replicative DNA helicase
MQASPQDRMILTNADHLVGNLWFNLNQVPAIAARLEPDIMATVAPGPAAQAYAEMCRLVRSSSDRLSAGALEGNLRASNFDFGWVETIQSRIEFEDLATLEGYAREIVNVAELRRVQIACSKATKAASQPDARATEVMGTLLGEIANASTKSNDVEHVSVPAARLRETFRSIRSGQHDWGAKTGFPALDAVFRMVDGDLIVLGGRPSQGKTSLARQILLHRAQALVEAGEEGQVVFFSADDTAEKVLMGMACAMSSVNQRAVRDNRATDEEWERLDYALGKIEALPIYVDATPSPTIEQIHYKVAMLHARTPVRMIALDYLELIRHPDARASDLQRVEHAARGVKGIGQAFGCPTLLLSQLRKEVDNRADKWPSAADVKFAGEAEADTMLLIMRPEHYLSRGEDCEHDEGDETGIALVNVAKNKTGEVGRVRLAFVKEYSCFYTVNRVNLNNF